jgi:hypothetical protein
VTNKIAPRSAFDCDLSQDAKQPPAQDREAPYEPPEKGAVPKLEAQRAARERSGVVHAAQLNKASFTYTREGPARPQRNS